MRILNGLDLMKSGINQLLTEWGPDSRFPQFQQQLTEHAAEGFIALAFIVGGFVLALIFEKKLGWLLVLGGLGYLLHVLGLF